MYVVCPHCIYFVEADIEVATKVAAKANDLYLLLIRRRALFNLHIHLQTGAFIRQAQSSRLKTQGLWIMDHGSWIKDQSSKYKAYGTRIKVQGLKIKNTVKDQGSASLRET